MKSDQELLRAYASEHSEAAFAGLVERYAGVVYASAYRQLGEVHAAREVSQTVFILLSRKAGSFGSSVVLIGWLMNATRFACLDYKKAEFRRRSRETVVYEESQLDPGASPPEAAAEAWREVEPALDDAVAALAEPDRNAIWLRFFQNKSLSEVGAALGIAEDAARKRVSRALDRLHQQLRKRGVTSPLGALPAAFSQSAVMVPEGVVDSVLKASANPSPALQLLSRKVAAQLAYAAVKASMGTVITCALLLVISSVSLQRTFFTHPDHALAGMLSDYRPAGFDNPAVVHEFIGKLRDAAASGDRAAVAGMCRFPLRVNRAGRSYLVSDAESLARQFDQVFTTGVCGVLLKSPLQGLFSNSEGVMIGDGTAWVGPAPGSAQPVQPQLIAVNVN